MATTTLGNVTDADALNTALGSTKRLGIDTEFMRERTYFAQLCLVQVATPAGVAFVDPIEEDVPEDLWTALLSRQWVLHSGRQDIEVLYQVTGRMPAGLFDTQIAAGLLGYQPQLGYAGLASELLGVELPKAHTRADWSRRPLAADLLEYAADDVEYLEPMFDLLAERLEAAGRLDWAWEDSGLLLDPDLYRTSAEGAEDRLKGARNLRGRARRAAVALARWREQRALDANRPRQWILKDAVLLETALRSPRNEGELAAVEGMPASVVRRSGRDILRLVAGAAEGEDDYQPPARPTEHEKAMLKRMQKEVARLAGELDVAPEVLAPRKELSAMMQGEREVRCLTGWRAPLFGERLVEILEET